ncbi:hypothetical protein QYE76_059511 [Lolium multiflorum]|uniref:Reverse transcriptase Ty1/copia-type domain-containing protein n=1 Tax=Lolium multiflorum TaxID=4521 RepID=A0AAD8RX52_LOLMU|nr:hypothetical protein QYE76_059511 [Lolium multiflorum]
MFPSTEPATSDHMRKYDLSYLSTNAPVPGSASPVQVSPTAPPSAFASTDPSTPAIDVHVHAPHPETPTPPSPGSPLSPGPPSAGPSQPVSPAVEGAPSTATPSAAPSSTAPTHAMVTRARDHTRRAKEYTDGTVRYDPRRHAFFATPVSHRDALHDAAWRDAMSEELNALRQTKTWILVPRPAGVNIVGSKWIFKTKQRPDGSVDKYKARLDARGFTQRHCIDYGDNFSPVVKPATQPPGFEDARYPSYVCKLQRSLYGLKQSPRAWYARLSALVATLGFVASKADTSLFTFTHQDVQVYMLVYVDDVVIAGSTTSVVDCLVRSLSASFPIKDLGHLHYFLGLEAARTSGGMTLTQRKYALDLLHRVSMENCRPTSTPLATAERLARDSGTALSTEDAFRYRSVVGGLQYLTLTRPDISFAVNKMEPVNTKFYQLGNGGSLIFEHDLNALSDHLDRPHPEFHGAQISDQPGGELQWIITADLRGKMEPPTSERILFSFMESNWLDGLARALQEGLARLCGMSGEALKHPRFSHLARRNSAGEPMDMQPHPELKHHVDHLDFMLYHTQQDLDNARSYANQTHLALAEHADAIKLLAKDRKTLRRQKAKKDATIARLRAKIASLEATVKAQEDQLNEMEEDGEDIQGGSDFLSDDNDFEDDENTEGEDYDFLDDGEDDHTPLDVDDDEEE